MPTIAKVIALIGIGLFYRATIDGVGALGIATALLVWVGWSLKQMPRVTFDDLSHEAQDLLRRYNHAWSFPAVTKQVASGCTFVILGLFIGAIVAFVRGEYLMLLPVGIMAVVMFATSGQIMPTAYIQKEGLQHAAIELQEACVLAQQTARDHH